MKRKILLYSLLPAIGVAGLVGANVASAHGLFGGGFGGGFVNSLTPDEIATRQQAMFQKEADLLGISVDEVKTAWAQGKTMQELMTEKGISQDTVQQRMKDMQTQQMKTHMQTLVDKGVITQAQADQRLQFVQNRMQNMTGKGRMGMMGWHRGFGL